MVKRWLITGGCGFIGRNLLRQLLREGDHAVRIIDNLSVGSREELKEIGDFTEWSGRAAAPEKQAAGSIELVVGDILDADLAVQCCQQIDVVVHLAANTGVGPSVDNPRMDCVTNVLGTFNYLEAARGTGVKRFVFASSGAPAGECQPPIHEELPPHPVSPYGASKLAGEGYCSAYYRSFGLETVALRFSNVYGPLSSKKESVVAKFIRRGLQGQAVEIYGDGSQTRDFLYTDDLVRAILLAARVEGIGGHTFQIATGRETTVLEMAELLGDLLQQLDQAKSLAISLGTRRTGDVLRNYSDISKAQSMLGWQPNVDLTSGLNRTLAWFLASDR